jgi:hypothetical protein
MSVEAGFSQGHQVPRASPGDCKGGVRPVGGGRGEREPRQPYGSQGDYAKAIDYHTQDLVIAKEVVDRAGEGSPAKAMMRPQTPPEGPGPSEGAPLPRSVAGNGILILPPAVKNDPPRNVGLPLAVLGPSPHAHSFECRYCSNEQQLVDVVLLRHPPCPTRTFSRFDRGVPRQMPLSRPRRAANAPALRGCAVCDRACMI